MIVAHNNSVICKCIVPADGTIDAGGIVIPVKNLPIYEILNTGDSTDTSRFNVGDKIIVNSTGTKIKLDDSEVYIFNMENIAGKVLN